MAHPLYVSVGYDKIKADVIRTYGHFGYTWQVATLDAPKLLVLTNQTKLTLTVTLTLTDTVTVIFLRAFC